MKKKEKMQGVKQEINLKNLTGTSKQYVNNARSNLMNKILQGCAEVDRKEQIEREKQQNYQRNKEFASGIVKDIKELNEKYEEQDNSVEADSVSVENISVA